MSAFDVPDGRGSFESPDNASDDASHFYFLLPSAKVGCHPAPFWLGAAAMTLIFFFLGFLASRLLLCWPLAMSLSLGLRMTQIECRIGHPVQIGEACPDHIWR